MNFSNDILLVMLISIFTSANDVDLNTNTNFLLLLLLALSASQNNVQNGCNPCNVGGVANTCSGRFI